MAASVVLYEYTGTNAGTTSSSDRFGKTDAGNSAAIRFRANDEGSETNISSNPLVKGGSAIRSMERWMRMRALSGIVTSLTAPKFYTANTTWDSGNVVPYIRNAGNTGATPATPANTSAFTTAHTYVTGNRYDLGTYGGSATVTTTPNPLGDLHVMIVEVQPAASNGYVGGETFTWAYDEA